MSLLFAFVFEGVVVVVSKVVDQSRAFLVFALLAAVDFVVDLLYVFVDAVDVLFKMV